MPRNPDINKRHARLNQRRYAEVVALLKSVIVNENTKLEQRLRATETLLGIYDRHDRSIASAERKVGKPSEVDVQNTPDEPVEPMSTVDLARRFIAGLNLENKTNE